MESSFHVTKTGDKTGVTPGVTLMDQSSSNGNLLEKFLENLTEVSETTKNDYFVKLRSLKRKMPLDGDEADWVDYFKGVENPNTRSNNNNALIQMRSYHGLPCKQLQDLKEDSSLQQIPKRII